MLIINYIRYNKLSKEEFCKLCDMDTSTLDEIIYLGKYDTNTLKKIAKILNIGFYEFFSYE